MDINLFYQPHEPALIVSDVFDTIGELPATCRSFSRVIEERRNPLKPIESMLLFRSPADVRNPADAWVISDAEWDIVFAAKEIIFDAQHNTANVTDAALETKIYNLHERIVKACIKDKTHDYNGLTVASKITLKIVRPADDTFITFHIWTSGETFINEYPDSDIYVIPPVPDIETLWAGHDAVALELINTPNLYLLNAVNAMTSVWPNTLLDTEDIHYHPDQCQSPLITRWDFVVYGKKPSHEERITAVIEYLKRESSHSIADWADRIFPDIYIRNEFIVLPNWDSVAITRDDTYDEVYSGFIGLESEMGALFTAHGAYSAEHIRDRSEVMNLSYKYMQLMTCGSPSNQASNERLSTLYPDYVSAKSSTYTYSRMSAKTITWERFMDRLIMAADTATNHMLSHDGIYHEAINDQRWAVSVHEGIRYVVLMRVQ